MNGDILSIPTLDDDLFPACAELRDTAQQIRETVPNPDDQLEQFVGALAAAVINLETGTLNLRSELTNVLSELRRTQTYVIELETRLVRAKVRLQQADRRIGT